MCSRTTDGRVVFALPFERDFTLIGTTDADFKGDLNAFGPSADEIIYLCDVATDYFRAATRPEDVVWSFAGVRSLYDDGSDRPEDITRDYVLHLDEGFHAAPALTIYGGKITTYRKLAEAALGKLAHFFAGRPAWTAGSSLPGGDFPHDAVEVKIAQMARSWPFLPEDQLRRMFSAYGTRMVRVLRDATAMEDLGIDFGAGLTEAEVRYLMATEWALEPDDVLWRRTKFGLRLSAGQREALARFMSQARNLHAAE